VQFDGTSWSSPEFAAMMAGIYQWCNFSTGFTNPMTIPYFVDRTAPGDFIDVIAGNDRISTTSPYYVAGPGYDDSNGIGVPKGSAFAQTACPGHVPASGLSVVSHQTMAVAARSSSTVLDVTPHVVGLIDRGERAANESTRIQIVLKPEFANPSSEVQIVSTLQRAGLTVVQRFANHLVIDAQGSNDAVERLFQTQLHNVAQGTYGMAYMPVRPVTLPAAIAPYTATLSIDSVATRHRLSHRTDPIRLGL
jgi:subtilase family serine protease